MRSMAAERREQIFEGLTRCIARYGIEGATLERLAAATGLSRSHVRHYVGNRDDQLTGLIEWLTQRYAGQLRRAINGAPSGEAGARITGLLFGETWVQDHPEDDAVIDAISAFSASNPNRGISLHGLFRRQEDMITVALVKDIGAPARACREVAYGLICLAYGNASMTMAGFSKRRSAVAKRAAHELIRSLDRDSDAG